MECPEPSRVQLILILAGVVIEYFLGRTKKLKANSGLELAINLVMMIVTYLKRRSKDGDPKERS